MNGSPCHESAPEPMDCCTLRSTPERQPAMALELLAKASHSPLSEARLSAASRGEARALAPASPRPPSAAERYTLHDSLLL